MQRRGAGWRERGQKNYKKTSWRCHYVFNLCVFVTLLCVFVCICVHGSHDRAKPKFQHPGRKGTFPCKKSLVKTKKDNNGLLVYIERRAFALGPQKHTQLCPSDDSTLFFHAGLPCREPLWTLQRMYFLHHDQ